MSETAAVRPDERFDADRVLEYLKAQGLPVGESLEVEQFTAGHSNLTYLLRSGAWQGVLRRPPLGPVAPKAHDMEREFHVLRRLHPVFGLAPEPFLYCGDTGVIGAPFYVMERRHGLVLDKRWPAAIDPAWRPAISTAAVDTLASLHAVDWQGAGLGDIGKPEGYMERQVQGWIGRWERAKTSDLDLIPGLCRWFADHLPPSPAPTIVHNDFKLNNMMLDPTHPGKVTAVLDWEMATAGDPLSDVGTFLSYWSEPGDEQLLGALVGVTVQPGFLSRREVLQRYASRTGRDVSAIDFYLAFGHFKVAVICQQIYFRWVNGQTRDPRFQALGQVAENLVRLAHRATQEHLL